MSLIHDLMRWARITKPGSDDKQFATQQMEYLGKVGDGIIVFPYGVHGNVPADALALMFAVQGNPDNRAAIAWAAKDRPTLKDGEVAFYHPPTDALIKWGQGGNLSIITGNEGTGNVDVTCKNATVTASETATIDAGTSATIKAPTITLDGDVTVTGTTTMQGASSSLAGHSVTGTMTNNGKDIGDTHGHAQGNDSGGNTEAAISGVT